MIEDESHAIMNLINSKTKKMFLSLYVKLHLTTFVLGVSLFSIDISSIYLFLKCKSNNVNLLIVMDVAIARSIIICFLWSKTIYSFASDASGANYLHTP